MEDEQTQNEERDLRKSESLLELISLLITAVPPGNDSASQHRDKIRQRVLYGLKKQDPELLRALGAPETWELDIELMAGWARKKWPNANVGIARFVAPTQNGLVGFSDSLIANEIPSDLCRCQAALGKAHALNGELRTVLRRQERELRRVQPLAKRYEEICAKNRASAEKPRGT